MHQYTTKRLALNRKRKSGVWQKRSKALRKNQSRDFRDLTLRGNRLDLPGFQLSKQGIYFWKIFHLSNSKNIINCFFGTFHVFNSK